MSVWTAIVLIVAIVLVTRFLREKHAAGRSERWDEGHRVQSAMRERELQREISELKERIQVLERIACDDRQRLGLADEIENLRD